ncbi:hypothetical protein MNBD_GAMMA11-2417 [hydrothermal vent metagenome]|uniref:YkgJ family cysteine cluster protein n=1 Tax=hydrothermal vent metagenome TaxID=652676 RepID=A0A3B0WZ51_9ZZZZ
MNKPCNVDCEQGRESGCQTYCCRLLIRLSENEIKPANDGSTAKGFIDKDPDGYCIHFNREKFLCRIWSKRPDVCKSYDCNNDFLLQAAIKKAFSNIVDLVNIASSLRLEKSQYIKIPYMDTDIK